MRINLIFTPWPISADLRSPHRFIEKTFYWCISDVANIRNIHLLLNSTSRICNITNQRVNFETANPLEYTKPVSSQSFVCECDSTRSAFPADFATFIRGLNSLESWQRIAWWKFRQGSHKKCLCQIAFSLWHVEKENKSRLKSVLARNPRNWFSGPIVCWFTSLDVSIFVPWAECLHVNKHFCLAKPLNWRSWNDEIISNKKTQKSAQKMTKVKSSMKRAMVEGQ